MSLKKWVATVAWIAVPSGILYLGLAFIGLAPVPGACITETLATITNLSGYDFLVTDTDCDTIAKTDWVRVFAAKSGESKRDLIFIYDPADDSLVPNITVDASGAIAISIAAVGSVIQQEHAWRGKNITYNIGKEYDPEPEPSPGER